MMDDSDKNFGKIISVFGKTGILESCGSRLNFLVKSHKLKPIVGDNAQWIRQKVGTIVLTNIFEPLLTEKVRFIIFGTVLSLPCGKKQVSW